MKNKIASCCEQYSNFIPITFMKKPKASCKKENLNKQNTNWDTRFDNLSEP